MEVKMTELMRFNIEFKCGIRNSEFGISIPQSAIGSHIESHQPDHSFYLLPVGNGFKPFPTELPPSLSLKEGGPEPYSVQGL